VRDPRIVFRSVWENPGNRGQRARRLLRALKWQVSKHFSRRPWILRLASGALFKAYPDCVISSGLIYADLPEYQELKFIRKLLKPHQAVIDVGANVGHILLLLCDIVPPSRLFAFEPTPISFRRLKENWLLNNWPVNNLYEIAVGEVEANMYIDDSRNPQTTNALHEHANAKDVSIKVIPLDSLFHLWHGLEIGLLKIDVEGFERAVFRGAVELLRKNPPRLLMFESLQGELDSEIGHLLKEYGYEVFQIDGKGEPQFGFANAQNLFAAPRQMLGS
jgi:FkbM family methyltransferase